jgi:hypothetical protein
MGKVPHFSLEIYLCSGWSRSCVLGYRCRRERFVLPICTYGGLVGGPANCSCDVDLLLFLLSTNLVWKRAAMLQLSSGFGSHHHFINLAMHSSLGHPISGLFPVKLWATGCCLSTIPARSIACFASRVGLRVCQGPVVRHVPAVGPLLGPDRLVAYCAHMEAVMAYISHCKKCGPCMQWILAYGNGLLPCQS